MPSKANVFGHPIHPMLVFFPVAFWILAFVLDIVYEAGGGGLDLMSFSYILLLRRLRHGPRRRHPGPDRVRRHH